MLTFEGQQFVGTEAIVKKLTVSCLLNSANQFGSVEILGELARRKNVQAVSNKNFCFNGFELSVDNCSFFVMSRISLIKQPIQYH